MTHGMSDYVIDVDAAAFQQAVIERSAQVPVVVDFWAPWCGPCRTLGPILERLAGEGNGTWILAKVNVDNNQRISQQYGVQGIPAVKAFNNGSICEQFTGAIPESQIRTWLKRIIPDALDGQFNEIKLALSTNPAGAKAQLAQFVTSHPQHSEAVLLYAGTLIRANAHNADDYLRQIPTNGLLAPNVAAWRTLLNARQSSIVVNNHPAAIQFAQAMETFARYDDAQTIASLLQIIASDRAWENDLARKTLLALFVVLGDTHPLVPGARRQLAALLF